MRGTWNGLSIAGAALLALAGCWTTDRPPKPAPNPEEFILPPEGDSRFSQPPTFPDKAMKEGLLRKDKDRDKDDAPPGSFRPPGRTGPGAGY